MSEAIKKILIFIFVLSGSIYFFHISSLAQEAPHIEKLLPEKGAEGSTIFVRGTGFTGPKDKIHVYFGELTAKILVSTSTSIAVEVPKGAGDCAVVVEIEGRKSNEVPFVCISSDSAEARNESHIKVSLDVSDPVADVGKTITGTFTAKGTDKPVEIHFTNDSPSVISLDGGNEQTVRTSGGGENIYRFPIRALTGPRHYTISFSWKNISEEVISHHSIWEKIDFSAKPLSATKDSTGQKKALPDTHRISEDKGITLTITSMKKKSAEAFELNIRNKSGHPLEKVIPAGTVFISEYSNHQRIITGRSVTVKCAPHGTATIPLEAWCLDYGKMPPPGGAEDLDRSWLVSDDNPGYAPLVRIIIAGNHLSGEGKFSQKIHDPEIYCAEIIQIALWSFISKDGPEEVNRETLKNNIDGQLAKLPKEQRPGAKEKEEVTNQLWSHVDLTLKEAKKPDAK